MSTSDLNLSDSQFELQMALSSEQFFEIKYYANSVLSHELF